MEWSWTTFVLEIVNLLVLVWLLSRLLYKPVRKAIEERAEAARAESDRAEAARRAADEELARAREEREQTRAAMETERRRVIERAEQAAARIQAGAEAEAAATRARARRALEREGQAARAVLREQTVGAVEAASAAVLAAAGGRDLDDGLYAALIERAGRLDEDERREALGGAAGDGVPGAVLQAVVAPSEARQAALAAALGERLGQPDSPPTIRVEIDPALRAGARLRIGGLCLDASIGAIVRQTIGEDGAGPLAGEEREQTSEREEVGA